jgi:hypothetical protein
MNGYDIAFVMTWIIMALLFMMFVMNIKTFKLIADVIVSINKRIEKLEKKNDN